MQGDSAESEYSIDSTENAQCAVITIYWYSAEPDAPIHSRSNSHHTSQWLPLYTDGNHSLALVEQGSRTSVKEKANLSLAVTRSQFIRA